MQPVELIKEICARHSAHDVDGALALCHDDVSFLWVATTAANPHSGTFSGREAFKAQLNGLHEAFEYNAYRPVDFVASGDRVASRAEIDLTHRASGRRFTVPVADFWTIRDGKVTELIEYYDTALIADVLK